MHTKQQQQQDRNVMQRIAIFLTRSLSQVVLASKVVPFLSCPETW